MICYLMLFHFRVPALDNVQKQGSDEASKGVSLSVISADLLISSHIFLLLFSARGTLKIALIPADLNPLVKRALASLRW